MAYLDAYVEGLEGQVTALQATITALRQPLPEDKGDSPLLPQWRCPLCGTGPVGAFGHAICPKCGAPMVEWKEGAERVLRLEAAQRADIMAGKYTGREGRKED